MSEFKCEVVCVSLEPHPNADAIEICRVGDYQSIVRKGQFKDGDLAVYIPEQAIVPDWMLREIGMYDEAREKGGLAGAGGNRVKAIKLRGVVSQGLMYQTHTDPEDEDMYVGSTDHAPNYIFRPNTDNATGLETSSVGEGDDVAAFLGIVKYEPSLPSHMRARIVGVDLEATHKYDFDNIKKMPTLFDNGEDIVITEKIHGTLMCVGVVPTKNVNDKYYQGRVIITSKGMGARGCVLDHDDPTNLYAQAAIKHGLLDRMLDVFGPTADDEGVPVFIFGEVFGTTNSGAGVQDLRYTEEKLDYRAFDICVGNRGSERYLNWVNFVAACRGLCVKHVPELYIGPFSKEVVLYHTDGPTTLNPTHGKTTKTQIREGVVVKSLTEERNCHFGRKIAKSVSNSYLLRSGDATEFN